MQKAPILKGSGLKPLEETKSSEEVHVFGKNLEERVITHKEDDKPPVTFASLQADSSQSENDIESIKKRKFDAITGEEDEETVFQGDFKLFVWDKDSSNWIEKGRGQLKLNDSTEDETTKSRLIMRISGTLRIILNVAIRQSTFRIIASSKTNIRFTDSLTVWAVSGSNAQQLKNSIEERLIDSGDATEDESTKKPRSDPVVSKEEDGEDEKVAHKDEDSSKPNDQKVTKDDEGSSESEVTESKDDKHEKPDSLDDSNDKSPEDAQDSTESVNDEEKDETQEEEEEEEEEEVSKQTEPKEETLEKTESKIEQPEQEASKNRSSNQVEIQITASEDNGHEEG